MRIRHILKTARRHMHITIAVLALFMVLLGVGGFLWWRLRIAEQSNQQLTKDAVVNSYQPGQACGVASPAKVQQLFKQPLMQSGSIVPANSPSSPTRRGSPRIDSCSYMGANSNALYLDLVIKTYDSPKVAADAYSFDTQKILGIADRNLVDFGMVDGLQAVKYASGVLYLLRGNMVYEVGGGQSGAALEPGMESFARSILEAVARDL